MSQANTPNNLEKVNVLERRMSAYTNATKALKRPSKRLDILGLGGVLIATFSPLSCIDAQCLGLGNSSPNQNEFILQTDVDGDMIADIQIMRNQTSDSNAYSRNATTSTNLTRLAGSISILFRNTNNNSVAAPNSIVTLNNPRFRNANGGLCNLTSSSTFSFGMTNKGSLGLFCSNGSYKIAIKKGNQLGFIELSISSLPRKNITVQNRGFAPVGVTSLDFSNLNCPSLPVELTTFKATPTQESIQLAWQTASEQNNAGFEVQRSENGKDFKTLAFVEGNGTTIEAQEYFFDDKTLRTNQLYYYRLKQIDFDGAFDYSDIITAELKGETKASVTLAPNPTATDFTNLEYVATTSGKLAIQVFDVNGKQLLTLQSEVAAGMNNINLDLSALAAGMYFVKLEQRSVVLYERLIKN